MSTKIQVLVHPSKYARVDQVRADLEAVACVSFPLTATDDEWPSGASEFDWAMSTKEITRLYGRAMVEIPSADAARLLALHDGIPPGPETVFIKNANASSKPGSPFNVCVGTTDRHVHGRRARRKLWLQPTPTSAQVYDAVLPWSTPLYVYCDEYVYEACSVSSGESTLVDDEWDDHPHDDCIFGWCATIVFEHEADYRRVRRGCGGRLCGWNVMWKKEEDDDCELAEAGGGSAASDDKDVDGRET